MIYSCMSLWPTTFLWGSRFLRSSPPPAPNSRYPSSSSSSSPSSSRPSSSLSASTSSRSSPFPSISSDFSRSSRSPKLLFPRSSRRLPPSSVPEFQLCFGCSPANSNSAFAWFFTVLHSSLKLSIAYYVCNIIKWSCSNAHAL